MVQSLSHVRLCDSRDCSVLGFPVLHRFLELAQTQVHGVGDAVQPSQPPSPPSSVALSLSHHQGLFQWVSSSLLKKPKYWSFSFSISPSNEYSGLIPFRIDWIDLLAVQETLKSLIQHYSSKASILWHSGFFMAQISYLYMTTGKTTALTIWTFACKAMALLFNTLSRFVMPWRRKW